MSFASDTRELRRVILFMLETHIIMSSLIFHIILILVFRLVLTLVLCLTLLLMLCLFYLINLTIAHLVLLHERTTLCPDTLVTVHVIIVAIVSCVCLVFLLEDIRFTLSPDTWTVHVFSVVVHVPLGQVVRC
jgi:hypothetical protein